MLPESLVIAILSVGFVDNKDGAECSFMFVLSNGVLDAVSDGFIVGDLS